MVVVELVVVLVDVLVVVEVELEVTAVDVVVVLPQPTKNKPAIRTTAKSANTSFFIILSLPPFLYTGLRINI